MMAWALTRNGEPVQTVCYSSRDTARFYRKMCAWAEGTKIERVEIRVVRSDPLAEAKAHLLAAARAHADRTGHMAIIERHQRMMVAPRRIKGEQA